MTPASSFEVPHKETGELLRFIRLYQRTASRVLRKAISISYRALFKATDIPLTTKFGAGMQFPHPYGIILDEGVQTGINCCILQNVTIQGATVLEDCVEIGANAVILGPLTLGKGCSIGAGAVVTKDVPPYHVAVGVPAKFYPNLKRYADKFYKCGV